MLVTHRGRVGSTAKDGGHTQHSKSHKIRGNSPMDEKEVAQSGCIGWGQTDAAPVVQWTGRCTAWCRCVDIHNVRFPCPAGEGWSPHRNWQGPQELLWELVPEAVGDWAMLGSQRVSVLSAAFPRTKARGSALSQSTDQGLGTRGEEG